MNLKDYATGLITNNPGTAGTTISVQDASRFPEAPFLATAAPDGELPTLGNAEKVRVTAVVDNNLTVERAQGSTTAKNIEAGWRLSNTLFEDHVEDIVRHDDSTFAVGMMPAYTDTTGKHISGTNLYTNNNDMWTEHGGFEGLYLASPLVFADIIDGYYDNAGVVIEGVHIINGLVDDRDLIADGTKLDGIEAGAEVNTFNGVNTDKITVSETEPTTPTDGELWLDPSGEGEETLAQSVGKLLMPVGFIYISNNPNNPASYLGFGTWQQIKGRFVVGVDDTDTDFDTAGKEGGHKDLQEHNHGPGSLGTSSDGSHSHSHPTRNPQQNSSARDAIARGSTNGSEFTANYTNSAGSHSHSISGSTDTEGTGDSGNLPPYAAKYIWERIA